MNATNQILTVASNALVIGGFSEVERDQISTAAARSSTSVAFSPSVQRGLLRMRGGEPPTCVLVSGELDVRQLVDSIRDQAELFAVPVLVALPRPSSDGYRAAFVAGADDVLITSDVGGLTRRLANLGAHRADVRPEATMGRAVIASRDESIRRRLGRTLRQVGFDVAYASDLGEVSAMAERGEAPAFAVTTDGAGFGSLVARAPGSQSGKLGEMPVLWLRTEDIEAPARAGDQVADITGKLLFFADEQAKAQFKDRRASARKLYATVCSFREAGSLQPIYGVSHNISREGMYVRTLDPPRPQSTVWLELRSPGEEAPIHMRARAMWQRLPGSGKGVLPPGFGLAIEAEQCPPLDLRAFVAGYEALPE